MQDLPPIPDIPKSRSDVETYIVPDGSCFLFDPITESGYALNQLDALVWDYCDGRTQLERIVADIVDLLPDDKGVPARVRRLISDFAAEGLLEKTGPNSVTGDIDD